MAYPSLLLFASSALAILVAVEKILKHLRLVGMEYDNPLAWWHGRQADRRRRKKPASQRRRIKSEN